MRSQRINSPISPSQPCFHLHNRHEPHHRDQCHVNTSCSGQTAIYGQMTAPPTPREVDANARRQRVRSYFIRSALLGRIVVEKDACLEALMEKKDLDEAFANRCWVQPSHTRTTKSRHADTSQGSPDQPQAGTTSSEATAAQRVLWNGVGKARLTQLTLRSRAGTTQHHTQQRSFFQP